MTLENQSDGMLRDLMAAREARNTGSQRGSIIQLTTDPKDAIAYAISVVNGESEPDRTEAMEALASRVSVLKHGDSDDSFSELAAHCPLLESMFLRYTLLAMTTPNPDVKMKYTKLALSCQSSFARTLALVSTLRSQRQGRARVLVHDDEGLETDDE